MSDDTRSVQSGSSAEQTRDESAYRERLERSPLLLEEGEQAPEAARPDVEPEEGLPDSKLVGEPRSQERFNQVLGHYLAEAISLSRASELLEMAPSTLRARFDRLEVPRRIAPSGQEEASRDVQTVLNWPDVVS